MASVVPSVENNIQALLLPSNLEKPGIFIRSTKGAQMNFKEYAKPTTTKKPIVDLLAPDSRSHADKTV